ncbi:ankyrin repeat domain-containing protein, partial [Aspergillus saccharolyticus JOP 1030-1]
SLQCLVSRGWDINTDVNDSVPSALVYTFEDKKLLEWFMKHGADPNKRCRIRDCTPLSYAVRDAPFEIIKLLFNKGGQIYHGQLLHYAAMRTADDNLVVLQFIYNQDPVYNKSQINKLLDAGSPNYLMNERNGLGTPLHYAASCGSVSIVTFLLDKGSVHDYLDPYHRTAMGYAVQNGHFEVQEILAGQNTDAST